MEFGSRQGRIEIALIAIVAIAVPAAIELGLVRPARAALEVMPPRFHGRLHGPPGRTTPAGTATAAFWWSVETSGEDSETHCRARARDGLVLETATARLPIAWSAIDPDLAGLITDRHGEYGFRAMFDASAIVDTVRDAVPAHTCTADGARYLETAIPDGTEVEVTGCERDGTIAACDANNVLAVDGIDAYLDRARWHATRWRWYSLIASGLVLAAVAVFYAAKRSRNVRA